MRLFDRPCHLGIGVHVREPLGGAVGFGPAEVDRTGVDEADVEQPARPERIEMAELALDAGTRRNGGHGQQVRIAGKPRGEALRIPVDGLVEWHGVVDQVVVDDRRAEVDALVALRDDLGDRARHRVVALRRGCAVQRHLDDHRLNRHGSLPRCATAGRAACSTAHAERRRGERHERIRTRDPDLDAHDTGHVEELVLTEGAIDH